MSKLLYGGGDCWCIFCLESEQLFGSQHPCDGGHLEATGSSLRRAWFLPESRSQGVKEGLGGAGKLSTAAV
jgi:hypothetical protein